MTGLKFGKPEPRVLAKRTARLDEADAERLCRKLVRERDHGHCRIPNCKSRDCEMHHVVPRSLSRAKRWLTSNNMLICRKHHSLRHAGKIQISGNADEELIITGDLSVLKFKL